MDCYLTTITIFVGIMSACAVFVTISPLFYRKLRKDFEKKIKNLENRVADLEKNQTLNNEIFVRITTILENLNKK